LRSGATRSMPLLLSTAGFMVRVTISIILLLYDFIIAHASPFTRVSTTQVAVPDRAGCVRHRLLPPYYAK